MQQLPLPDADAPARKSVEGIELEFPRAEVVFGLTYAVGTDYKPVLGYLEDYIRIGGYKASSLHISDWFQEWNGRLGVSLELRDDTEHARITSRIAAGNSIRLATRRKDIFALQVASKLSAARVVEDEERTPFERTAHIVCSLKRPEEVAALARIYGAGFYLIGIFATESERRSFLVERKNLTEIEAEILIERDQKEASDEYGQRTRDTFQMADFFVGLERRQYEPSIRRFIELVFGNPFTTPTRDEHAMFLAYSASLRSGDLARQVGAALASEHGDVISLGCNDVPAPGGGLYCTDDGSQDQRDYVRKADSNDVRKAEIVEDVINGMWELWEESLPDADQDEFKSRARMIISRTRLSEVTEFGRSVHAEMDALIAAGRSGASSRGSTLYTTTFPCHNCTRHIIAAGVRRVVYIEPYPKSLAPQLHDDAITHTLTDESDNANKIPFEPFLGIGPRRFFDLFSMKLSSGYTVERKSGGKAVEWAFRKNAVPRVPLPPIGYIQREEMIQTIIDSLGREIKEEPQGNAETSENTVEIRPGILGPGSEHRSKGSGMARLEDRRPPVSGNSKRK